MYIHLKGGCVYIWSGAPVHGPGCTPPPAVGGGVWGHRLWGFGV